MQRISSIYVKRGMIIEYPVYDYWGDLIIEKGTCLDSKEIATITDIGIGELFIANEHTQDITLKPLLTPGLSGALSKALRRIIIETKSIMTRKNEQSIDIQLAENLIEEMILQLSDTNTGEISLNGCFSLRDYNYVHPVKVASIAVLIGKASGMSDKEIKNMALAAFLQNVGYVLLPHGILDKPGPLDSGELQTIQKHPIYGAEILQRYTNALGDIIEIIVQHHERWNGTGYPFQMKQNAVSKAAQIIGIVDTCFALASKRPHREEFLPAFAIEHSIVSPSDAIEFIFAYSGELFSPELVRAFTHILPFYPAGVKVKLNNGKDGIICGSNSSVWRRPKIRLFQDNEESGLGMEAEETENLLKNSEEMLVTCKKGDDINLAHRKQQHILITEVFDY